MMSNPHPNSVPSSFPKEYGGPVNIQKVLDYNAVLICTIIEYQQKGKTENIPQYMNSLHMSLKWLNRIMSPPNLPYDPNTFPQPRMPMNPSMVKNPSNMPGTHSQMPHMMNGQPNQLAYPTNPGMNYPANPNMNPSTGNAQSSANSQSFNSQTHIGLPGQNRPNSPPPIYNGASPFDFPLNSNYNWQGNPGSFDMYNPVHRLPPYNMPPSHPAESMLYVGQQQQQQQHARAMHNMDSTQRQQYMSSGLQSSMYRSLGHHNPHGMASSMPVPLNAYQPPSHEMMNAANMMQQPVPSYSMNSQQMSMNPSQPNNQLLQ